MAKHRPAVYVEAPAGIHNLILDYRENTARFDLLHFAGFSEQARFELQHRLKEMDLTKAVE